MRQTNLKMCENLSYVVQQYIKSVRIKSFSGPNAGKYQPEKLRIRTLFTQCNMYSFLQYSNLFSFESYLQTRDSGRKCLYIKRSARLLNVVCTFFLHILDTIIVLLNYFFLFSFNLCITKGLKYFSIFFTQFKTTWESE